MRKRNTNKHGLLYNAIAELRAKMVGDALVKFKYNKAKAARWLGIERTGLIAMLKYMGLKEFVNPPVKAGNQYTHNPNKRKEPVSASPYVLGAPSGNRTPRPLR